MMWRGMMGVAIALVIGAPAVQAKPANHEAKLNVVRVKAKTVPVARGSADDYARLDIDNLHRTEARWVIGIVRLMKGADVLKQCDFEVMLAAAGKDTQHLRECRASGVDGIQVELTTAEMPERRDEPEEGDEE